MFTTLRKALLSTVLYAALLSSIAAASGAEPTGNGFAISQEIVSAFKQRESTRALDANQIAFETTTYFLLLGRKTNSGDCIFTSRITMPPDRLPASRFYAEDTVAVDPLTCEKIVARGYTSMPHGKFNGMTDYSGAATLSRHASGTMEPDGTISNDSVSPPYNSIPTNADYYTGLLSVWTDGNNPIFALYPPESRPHIMVNYVDTTLSIYSHAPCGLPFYGEGLTYFWPNRYTGWDFDPNYPYDAVLEYTCGGYVYNGDGTYTGTSGGWKNESKAKFVNDIFLGCLIGPGYVTYEPNSVSIAYDGGKDYVETSFESGNPTACAAWFDHMFFIHDSPVDPNILFIGNQP